MVDLAVRHGWAQGGSAVAKLEQMKLIGGACCGTGLCILVCKACSREIGREKMVGPREGVLNPRKGRGFMRLAVVVVHVYWFIVRYNSGCALFIIKSALPQVLLQCDCARVFMSETVMSACVPTTWVMLCMSVCVCIYIYICVSHLMNKLCYFYSWSHPLF